MPKNILVRVQSPDGTKRVEVGEESLESLYGHVFEEFKISPEKFDNWSLFTDREKQNRLPNSFKTPARSVVSHGDMIYLLQAAGNVTQAISETPCVEDEIDIALDKKDGLIHRKKDDLLCHHGEQGKCINCVPLEPYDMSYLSAQTPPIKFVSFHGYLKSRKSGINKGKYLNLESLDCKIKPGCIDHLPWPKGICNKCQPSSVYLNRQTFRHVDNIMFENGTIVEKFLNFWRRSGHQRIGLLYGHYEEYDGVPLGIKAVVSAIYEPPQSTSQNHVELILPDPNQEKIDEMSKKLGLRIVGWIFTDLVTEDARQGTVKNFRGNSDTYFLTADECIMAGYFQDKYRNACKYSSDKYFGSKFVTVVITGDADNQIQFQGYQVSNQCTSLVRDECIVPTYDAPELAYIRDSSDEKFIPDVYFREKDSYNNEVTKKAQPLPVEYLIIDMPAAFAKDPIYILNDGNTLVKTPFPIENRAEIGEIQSFDSVQSYMKQFQNYQFLDAISSFHFLIFLVTNQAVHFDSVIDTLIEAINTKDVQKAMEWSRCPEWLTVEQFYGAGSQDHDMGSASNEPDWPCSQCTYLNEASVNMCGICQSPRNM